MLVITRQVLTFLLDAHPFAKNIYSEEIDEDPQAIPPIYGILISPAYVNVSPIHYVHGSVNLLLSCLVTLILKQVAYHVRQISVLALSASPCYVSI